MALMRRSHLEEPGSASARNASTRTIRACGGGLRSIFACSIPGRAMSSV